MAGQSWPVINLGLGTAKPTPLPKAKPQGKSVWQVIRVKGENSA